MCSQEATLPGHTHLPLFQCEHHGIISYHASSVFCEQRWRHIATFMITNKVINFNVSTTYFLCVICRRVEMSLLLSDESIYNTILVSGSESSHSRVILKVMAALDTISFTSRPEALLNIAK